MLKYMNPLWYPYALFLKLPYKILVKLFFAPLKCWRLTKETWKKYDKVWQRLLFTSLIVWTVIPGTWLWLFYKLSAYVGLQDDIDAFISVASTVAKAVWFTAKIAYITAASA